MTLPLNIFVDKEILKSVAFKELAKTKYALLVLLEFNCRAKRVQKNLKKKKKHDNFVLGNNGHLKLSYTEAEQEFGIPRLQFAKILKVLTGLGFIDRSKRGGNIEGDHSLYAISDRWKKYGTNQFIENAIKKDRRKWNGWDKYHETKNQ